MSFPRNVTGLKHAYVLFWFDNSTYVNKKIKNKIKKIKKQIYIKIFYLIRQDFYLIVFVKFIY
jgi:hypothetical protein